MPMRQLAQTAHRIAGGHWQERVGDLKGAEPVEVGQAFNSMLDELSAVQKRLVQAASLSAVGELSASVVHEMRNPLSSIKMNLKAIRERVREDPAYSELADIASGQVERLEQMLNDLLQYGKPLEIRREKLRFQDLTDEVKDSLSHQLEMNRVGLNILDHTNGIAFAVDREQVARAVINLVDNAIRVSPENTTVGIGGDIIGGSAGPSLKITVWDSGPGIPKGSFDKLFTPFFTTRGDGTGLGLANVRKIAELHGGSVEAENLPEGGAKFTLTLFLGERV
jgi:signal transduction histidine kinase